MRFGGPDVDRLIESGVVLKTAAALSFCAHLASHEATEPLPPSQFGAYQSETRRAQVTPGEGWLLKANSSAKKDRGGIVRMANVPMYVGKLRGVRKRHLYWRAEIGFQSAGAERSPGQGD